MRFSDNRDIYIRRALFVFLVGLTAIFQHTAGALPSIFGAKAMVLIPLTVCIGMYERSISGLAFGVIAGALWDFATVRGDGFFSVALATVGFFSGFAVTWFIRNNIFSALILSAFSVTAVNTAYWFVFIFMKEYEGSVELLTGFYLPSALYTIAFTFLYYRLAGLVLRLTSGEKRRKSY